MATPIRRRITPQDFQHLRRTDRIERERQATPQYLDDLTNVSAFDMGHRQIMAYNKFTGMWEPYDPPDLPYGFPDDPTLGDTFGYSPRGDFNVVGASLLCNTTGSSSTIMKFKKNGTTFLTLTMGSGVHIVTGTVSAVGFIANSDILKVTLDTVGTGVKGVGGAIWTN